MMAYGTLRTGYRRSKPAQLDDLIVFTGYMPCCSAVGPNVYQQYMSAWGDQCWGHPHFHRQKGIFCTNYAASSSGWKLSSQTSSKYPNLSGLRHFLVFWSIRPCTRNLPEAPIGAWPGLSCLGHPNVPRATPAMSPRAIPAMRRSASRTDSSTTGLQSSSRYAPCTKRHAWFICKPHCAQLHALLCVCTFYSIDLMASIWDDRMHWDTRKSSIHRLVKEHGHLNPPKKEAGSSWKMSCRQEHSGTFWPGNSSFIRRVLVWKQGGR